MSKEKVHFNDIQRSVRHNPDLPRQESHPDAHSDTKSISSSKKMDIFGETPHRFAKFENVSLNNTTNSFDDANEILEVDRIPPHVRSIQELLSNKEKLEYYITHNAPIVIDILTNYELIKEQYVTLDSLDSLFSYELLIASR